MPKVNTIACGECGTQKRETNHWLVAIRRIGYEGVIFEPADAVDDEAPECVYEYLCGHGCAQRHFERWLDDTRNIIYPTRNEKGTEA